MDFLTANLLGGMFGLYNTVQQYLYLYMPLLTMGLMSREFSSGSIKLLYSSPVTSSQIVMGKFLAMITHQVGVVGNVNLVYRLRGLRGECFTFAMTLSVCWGCICCCVLMRLSDFLFRANFLSGGLRLSGR